MFSHALLEAESSAKASPAALFRLFHAAQLLRAKASILLVFMAGAYELWLEASLLGLCMHAVRISTCPSKLRFSGAVLLCCSRSMLTV